MITEKTINIVPFTTVENLRFETLPESLVFLADIEEAHVLKDTPWTIAQITNKEPRKSGISSYTPGIIPFSPKIA